MEISAELVKELREKSGAGIMECKRALKETKGDLSEAIDFLRKEGIVKASKKAGRTASEGLIGEATSADGSRVTLVEVNCETDFVARTDQFQKWVRDLGQLVVERAPANLENLLSEKMAEGTVQESLQGLIAKLGENMSIRRFSVIRAGAGEKVGQYLHAGSKIGVLVKIHGEKIDAPICRDIAMHVAAMHPTYLDRGSVPAAVVEKEREILKSSPELSGKPAELQTRIIDGKLSRFFSETCLVEQPFIKDPSGKKTVGAFLKERDPKAVIVEMVRFQVGDNG